MYIGLGTFVAAMLLMIPSFKTAGLLEPFSKEFRDARKLMRWGGGSAPYDYHMCAGFRELTADVDARLSRSWSRMFAIRIGLVIVAFVLLFIGIVVKTSPTSTRLILVALGVAFFALRELLYILLIGRTSNTLAR